jgi:hypothetical protein
MADGQSGKSLTDLLKKQTEKLKELQKKEPTEDNNSAEPDKIIDDEEDSDDLVDTKEKSPVQSAKALPKFMKFEDYIATKNKK